MTNYWPNLIADKRVVSIYMLAFLLVTSMPVLSARHAVKVMHAKALDQPLGQVYIGTVVSQHQQLINISTDGHIDSILPYGTTFKKDDLLVGVNLNLMRLKQTELTSQLSFARKDKAYLEGLKQKQLKMKSLSVSKDQLEKIDNQLNQAISQVGVLESRLLQLKEVMHRSSVYASFDGVVIEQLVQVGDFISQGQLVMKSLDTGSLQLSVFIPVNEAQNFSKGHQLKLVNFESLNVDLMIPTPSNQSVELRANLPKHLPLMIGQPVQVELTQPKDNDLLQIHQDSLLGEPGNFHIYVIDSNDFAKKVKVVIVKRVQDQVVVKGMIKVNDQIVVRGLSNLADGDEVNVVGEL